MNIGNIKSDVYFLTNSTSASYPNADLIRNVNIAYHDIARLIWESSYGWQYDDSNATTLPVAKTTLVHNQQDYSLPTNAQRVLRVEVKDSNSNWLKLKPLDIHDISIAMPEYLETANIPVYYDLIGRSLMLYPKPHSGYCTTTSGLAIYVDRNVTEFVTTATTTTPGFATAFHRILSYAAAIDFSDNSPDRQFLIQQKSRLENGLIRFYSKQAEERQPTLRPSGRRGWRKYT